MRRTVQYVLEFAVDGSRRQFFENHNYKNSKDVPRNNGKIKPSLTIPSQRILWGGIIHGKLFF